MATATIGTTYASEAKVLGTAWADVCMHESTVYQLIEKNSDNVEVDKVTKNFYTYRGVTLKKGFPGINVAEAASRPTYLVSTPGLAKWGMVISWIPADISVTAKNAGGLVGPAALDALQLVKDDTMTDWALLADQNMLTQNTGWLCQITQATSTGTTYYVDDASLLRPGMPVDIDTAEDGATPDELDGGTIVSVDYVNNTFVADSDSASVGSYVFRGGCGSTFTNGLGDLIGDGSTNIEVGDYSVRTLLATYGNINRTTSGNEQWQATLYKVGTNVDPETMHLRTAVATHARRQGVRKAKFTHALAGPMTMAQVAEVVPVEKKKGGTRVEVGEDGHTKFHSPLLANKAVELEGVPGYKEHIIDFLNFKHGDPNSVKLRWVGPPTWADVNGEIWHDQRNDASGARKFAASFDCTWQLIGVPMECMCVYGFKTPNLPGVE